MPTTFSRILVPLDGSERAEGAIPVAACLARASHASVLLVHVTNPALPFDPQFGSSAYTIQMEVEAAAAYLRDIAGRDVLAGVAVQTRVMEQVQAATALLDAVELHQCDLVVMCSHGRHGVARWALGSVAQKLARHSPVPVLVLRANESASQLIPLGEHPFCTLVALDGSTFAEAALAPAARVAAALAAPGSGALRLLRVLDPWQASTGWGEHALMDRAAREAAQTNAQAYMHDLAARLQAGEVGQLGLRVTWSVVEDADAAAMVLAVAENDADPSRADPSRAADRDHCDLIAMATHGRIGARLWAMGSVTNRVLQASTLPLLIVRPLHAASAVKQEDVHARAAERDVAGEAESWPEYD